MILWARRKGHLWLSRPQWLFDGMGLKNIPAVPFDLSEIVETVPKLLKRTEELTKAKTELANSYTIDGVTKTGKEFMFDDPHLGDVGPALRNFHTTLDAHPRRMAEGFESAFAHIREEIGEFAHENERFTTLALEDPKQFSMSWTNYDSVYEDAITEGLDATWGAALTDPAEAARQFWPMISEHGLGYNLLVLQKVRSSNRSEFEGAWPGGWPDHIKEAFDRERLYVIDMSLFQHVEPARVGGLDRVTPSTTTWLTQDPATKTLTPVAVRVSNGTGPSTFYGPDDPAWLYGLQAARTSITVWGIWIGHVYHWHIVSAAMQMTMYNTVPGDHILFKMLAPQSRYLIPFDDVLLLLWGEIAPPTSISTPRRFLRLCDTYATDRDFFDDDPKPTLERFGIDEKDFTVSEPWDQYPVAGHLLRIWSDVEEYVRAVVYATYNDDQAVAQDRTVRKWIKACAHRCKGNIRGLPRMDGREPLTRVLTSLIYRITVHGSARLMSTIHPAETFVANFPPCLQRTDVPDPTDPITGRKLLEYLPRTGTIGEMVRFYFIFTFSKPYEPLISDELFFGNDPDDPRNVALVKCRNAIKSFIQEIDRRTPVQFEQWPLNIET